MLNPAFDHQKAVQPWVGERTAEDYHFRATMNAENGLIYRISKAAGTEAMQAWYLDVTKKQAWVLEPRTLEVGPHLRPMTDEDHIVFRDHFITLFTHEAISLCATGRDQSTKKQEGAPPAAREKPATAWWKRALGRIGLASFAQHK